MRQRRAGFTLIELTVVMTILSLVWLSITCVLYTLYRADHRLRDELQHEHAMNRLATRLRLDAHTAHSANLLDRAEGGNELVLTTVEQRNVHYGVSDEGVYRIVRKDEAILHRDVFRVGRVTEQWELRSSADPSLIVVTLTSRDGRSQSTRIQRIKAAVATTQVAVAKTTEASL
jgi:prepilin-type N-terminal cleavage/methylation domain-containing protein